MTLQLEIPSTTYRTTARRCTRVTEEMIVDNFAGGGGASMGIERALGRSVDLAINHDEAAVVMHQANHPGTRHLCENVFDVDPRRATHGRPVGLAWFSPACQHFSKARGGRPVSKQPRALAWVVVRWAAAVRPRVIILENVEEFAEWSPLVNGRPCQRRRGETFRQWVGHLQKLGYVVEWRELSACDYGAPTSRKRLFVIARNDGQDITWPEPTHGTARRPHRTAAEVIDWSLPCPSVHLTREQGRAAGAVRPLSEITLRKIAEGGKRFLPNKHNAWIFKYYGTGGGQSLDEPLHTITTKDRFALVVTRGGDIGMRMLTPRELAAAHDFPADYVLTGTKTNQVARIGNSVVVSMAEALVRANYAVRRVEWTEVAA